MNRKAFIQAMEDIFYDSLTDDEKIQVRIGELKRKALAIEQEQQKKNIMNFIRTITK